MTAAEIASTRRLALAHRLLDGMPQEFWQQCLLPYLIDERDRIVNLMADCTDAFQMARYAGSMQTLTSLIRLEQRCRCRGISRR